MSSDDVLNLNDAVHIEQTSITLEGIVAHLGSVQFAPGQDWIGIRLTGASVGKGKNDGSVKGVQYFNAGGAAGEGKNGMFVKRSHVTKRKLSRLEELRLRRELSEMKSSAGAGGASAAGSASAGRTSIKSPTPRSATASKTTPKKTVAKTTATAAGGGSNKLEELRARREALAKERGQGSVVGSRGGGSISTPAAATKNTDTKMDEGEEKEESKDDDDNNDDSEDNEQSPAPEPATPTLNLQTATPGYRTELLRLQTKITTLQTSLTQKNYRMHLPPIILGFHVQGCRAEYS
mmetsp:Transcript_7307/g.16563  ORF Transcript_7307/g.16563 Transcript_7307/m.16563 type:complete len:292 (+) Transcript_7307:113-988(+)